MATVATVGSKGRLFIGRVSSNKAAKTITVKVDHKVWNEKYKIWLRRTSKFYAHDEAEVCNIGDEVEVQECRPMSRMKRFMLKRVVKPMPQFTAGPLPPPQNFTPFILGHQHNALSATTAAARVGAGANFTTNVPANPSTAAATAGAPAVAAAAGSGTEAVGLAGDGKTYIRDIAADKAAALEAAKVTRRAEHQLKRNKKQLQQQHAAAASRGDAEPSFATVERERTRAAQLETAARQKAAQRSDAADAMEANLNATRRVKKTADE